MTDFVEALKPIWSRVCKTHHWIKTADGPRHIRAPLKKKELEAHLDGTGYPVGCCPITPGTNTTQIAVLDLDSHKGATPWDEMQGEMMNIAATAENMGLRPYCFRSTGGHGIHIYFLWEEPQDAAAVRARLNELLSACGFKSGTKGVSAREIEVFPKQDSVPADGFGSMFILPLAGDSVPLDPAPMPRDWILKTNWPTCEPVTPPVMSTKLLYADDAPPAPISADLAELASALDAIPNSGEHELDYDDWRNVIFAIYEATEGSDEGLQLAHALSSRSSKYDADFLDNEVWPYIKTGRDKAITARTIYSMARANGWEQDASADFDVVDEPESDAPAAPKRHRFDPIPMLEIARRPPPEWIVKGVVPRAELGVIYGESGSGKSFFAFDLVAAIARGIEWRGIQCKPGNVAYIAAEGGGGYTARAAAYAQHHDLTEINLDFVMAAPNLLEDHDVELARRIGKRDVIVVDTLAQTTPGANENAGEDMGKVLSHCKRLHRATGALVILIHHAGKDLTKGARGWSGLKAAADFEIEITRLGDARIARVSKLKDGEDGAQFAFKLSKRVVGEDAAGDAVESCVVEAVDAPAVQRVVAPKGAKEKIVWQVINDLCGVGENNAPVLAVVDEAVRRAPEPEEGKRDQRRKDVKRAIESLQAAGWVTVLDGVVTIAER